MIAYARRCGTGTEELPTVFADFLSDAHHLADAWASIFGDATRNGEGHFRRRVVRHRVIGALTVGQSTDVRPAVPGTGSARDHRCKDMNGMERYRFTSQFGIMMVMSTQIAVRLPEDIVAFLDSEVSGGRAKSRAQVVLRALEREQRRQLAARDVEILSDGTGTSNDVNIAAAHGRRAECGRSMTRNSEIFVRSWF